VSNHLHLVEINDDGRSRAEVRLDGLRVRGLLGYDVSRSDDRPPEITIKFLAGSLNPPQPEVGAEEFARPAISAPVRS
jgi:hypothetical protein